MDVKFSETSTNDEQAKTSVKKKKSISLFIQELKSELRKVSWTPKHELIFATKTVVLATFVLGFSIYLVDLCVKGLLELIKASVLYIFG